MPVIQVFAAPVDDAAVRLEAICREVADALSLQPADVVATHVVVAATVIPGRASASWPVVVVHGSAREPSAMDDARERLRSLVATWSHPGPADGVWVTWQFPE